MRAQLSCCENEISFPIRGLSFMDIFGNMLVFLVQGHPFKAWPRPTGPFRGIKPPLSRG